MSCVLKRSYWLCWAIRQNMKSNPWEDPKGLYEILGVDVNADETAIRCRFATDCQWIQITSSCSVWNTFQEGIQTACVKMAPGLRLRWVLRCHFALVLYCHREPCRMLCRIKIKTMKMPQLSQKLNVTTEFLFANIDSLVCDCMCHHHCLLIDHLESNRPWGFRRLQMRMRQQQSVLQCV